MEMVINMDASPSPADREGDRRCHQEDHSHNAVAFLKRFHPATPWMLVTIDPSGKIGPAATFDPKRDEANGLKFIEENNGKRNIYFTVNRVNRKLTKKPAKSDIAEILWLHADVDLKLVDWSDAEAVSQERECVLQLLRSFTPTPTLIIWTGGGFQVFWRLSEIIVVSGDPTLMASVERRMQRIAKELGGDACWNADRIMRLPCTMNMLGKSKIEAGRKPALAEVIEFHDDRIYDLEEFSEVELRRSSNGINGSAHHYHTEREEMERIQDALRYIPADDYTTYFDICASIKSGLGDPGFGIAREWAMTSIKFDDSEFRRKWASLKPDGGITVATLYGMAKQHGWRDDRAPDRRDRRQPGGAGQKRSGPAGEGDSAAQLNAWPIMQSKAMHGIVGRIARLATETSEADPVAVIASVLAYAGAELGRGQGHRIGEQMHHSRHFNAIVGQSARGRKGTSYGPVRRIFLRAEAIRIERSTLPFPSGRKLRISNGPMSSGEGLIYAVRDGDDNSENGDAGVIDKRLLVVEEEFGAALRAFQRNGNNLSMILRMMFDGNTVEPLTKSNRLISTDPHVNIIAHITSPELKGLMSGSEIWNGFSNRFLWLSARRSKVVPDPQPMPDDKVEEIAQELARVIILAHENSGRALVMSNSAHQHWGIVYAELTQEYPGVLGAVTSRLEVHARRLALTYAQLDGSDRIEIDHLEAALAVCRYAFDSAAYLFGKAELNPVAQKIMDALAEKPMTQTEIMGLFHRNVKSADLEIVLKDLQERGRITLTRPRTGERGRSPSIWTLNERNE